MKVRTVLRTLRQVRHLLPEQIAAQLAHVVSGRVEPVQLPGDAPRLRVPEAAGAFLPAPAHARGDPDRIELIHRGVDFADGIDWDFAGEGPLWSFHLHQFDWLRQPELAPALRTAQLLDWVERHPRGVGWRPHPISLRILSWGKLLLTPGALQLNEGASARIRHSLACQAETLARNPERRLQANHLLSNWIGVVFAGLLFDGHHGDAWLAHASELRGQLDKQIGPDGSHVERSPMYHSLLLENLLDLLNLARAVGQSGGSSQAAAGRLADDLAACTSRMLGALELWTHPDGEIALFADSAHAIAHPPVALHAYARALGVQPASPRRAGVLADSGFVRLESGPFCLIASVAGPMPAYMPGHAHCDALAFELSLAGERVVTDTGVLEYTPGTDRELCRATRSHATVEVDGFEQAEIFAAHRIGGRPEVALLAADPPRSLEASCISWGSRGARHRRVFELDGDSLSIHDFLEGGPRPVRIAFPLAPGLEPDLAPPGGGAAEVRVDARGSGWRGRIPLASGRHLELDFASDASDSSRSEATVAWRVESAAYFPEFGKRVDRRVLVGVADGFESGRWIFRLPASSR